MPGKADWLEFVLVGVSVVTAECELASFQFDPNKCLRAADIAAVRCCQSWQ